MTFTNVVENLSIVVMQSSS